MGGRVHVIGAGVAGLSAAERLVRAGADVALYEAAPQAGGRCRTYHDDKLGMAIDNGNHLLLSGNTEALGYVRRIGGEGALSIAPECRFPFIDMRTGERWTLHPTSGRMPRWIFDPVRRLPASRAADYLAPTRLLFATSRTLLGQRMAVDGPLYERLWRPLLLAALNTEPADASARLAATLLRETLALGGDACRPVIATHGLGAAFVDPAVAFLRRNGVPVRFGVAARAITAGGGRATALRLGTADVALGVGDRVILAVPPSAARTLLPGLVTPDDFAPILNLHFRVDDALTRAPPMMALVNATAEWLFAYCGRLSVTISAADRLLDRPRESLAREVWREVATVTGAASELPPWQVIAERRATFRATPAQLVRRPPATTRLVNVFLAGDWTATGLPATIEGAVRSGAEAARLALRGMKRVAPERLAA